MLLSHETDSAHETTPLLAIPREVLVGTVSESEQHITLPGILTETRSRSLRVPAWAVGVVVGVLAPADRFWGFFVSLVT